MCPLASRDAGLRPAARLARSRCAAGSACSPRATSQGQHRSMATTWQKVPGARTTGGGRFSQADSAGPIPVTHSTREERCIPSRMHTVGQSPQHHLIVVESQLCNCPSRPSAHVATAARRNSGRPISSISMAVAILIDSHRGQLAPDRAPLAFTLIVVTIRR